MEREALITLTQTSLDKASGIQRIEEAATELYKALQAGRDTGKSIAGKVYLHFNNNAIEKWLLLWRGLMNTGPTTLSSVNVYMTTYRSWWLRRSADRTAVYANYS